PHAVADEGLVEGARTGAVLVGRDRRGGHVLHYRVRSALQTAAGVRDFSQARRVTPSRIAVLAQAGTCRDAGVPAVANRRGCGAVTRAGQGTDEVAEAQATRPTGKPLGTLHPPE